MNTNDHDFIIKTVVEFYSEEEINSAQHLLFETCEETNLQMKTYRKDAAKLYCRDITVGAKEIFTLLKQQKIFLAKQGIKFHIPLSLLSVGGA